MGTDTEEGGAEAAGRREEDARLLAARERNTLGALVAAAGPAAGAALALRARELSGPDHRGDAALLAALPPDEPAWAPFWAALLAERGFFAGSEIRARAWARLGACARGDKDATRAMLRVGRPTDGPWEPRLVGELRVLLPPAERAALLNGRIAAGTGGDELSRALALGLGGRARRRIALRRAAARPGTDPGRDQPHTWPALAGGAREQRRGPEGAGAGERGATGASRIRCARWLAGRPRPAWAAALALSAGDPGRGPILRALATRADGRGRQEAAWGLADLGEPADAETIEAAFGARGGQGPWDWRVGRALGTRPDDPLARAAARGVIRQAAARAGEHGSARALAALEILGEALDPAEGATMAAGLLTLRDGGRAARWLVRHAPELASAWALAQAGLLPGVEATGEGTFLAGGTRLRRRAGGGFLRDAPAGTGTPKEAEARLRATDTRLRQAWAAALGDPRR